MILITAALKPERDPYQLTANTLWSCASCCFSSLSAFLPAQGTATAQLWSPAAAGVFSTAPTGSLRATIQTWSTGSDWSAVQSSCMPCHNERPATACCNNWKLKIYIHIYCRKTRPDSDAELIGAFVLHQSVTQVWCHSRLKGRLSGPLTQSHPATSRTMISALRWFY